MSIRFYILLVSAVSLLSCSTQDEPEDMVFSKVATVVSVALKPRESFLFNTFDQYSRTYEFKNSTDKDTVITRQVKLAKPSLWQYGNILVLETGPVLHTYSVMLLPGDTVSLKGATDGALAITQSSGYQKILDSLISLPKDFYWHDVKLQHQLLETKGIKGILASIEDTYQRNEARIGQLKLPALRNKWLKIINVNIKYTAIAQLLNDQALKSSLITDSLYKEIFADHKNILSVDAINNNAIKGAIVAWNAKKRNPNLRENDFWAYAAAADNQLKQTRLYRDYLKAEIAAKYLNTPKELVNIKGRLASIRATSVFLDTLYKVTIILNETLADYPRAKKKLRDFAGGDYAYIMEGDDKTDHHEIKPTNNLPVVPLYNFAGKMADFKDIVANDQYQLTLVDFWASWCIPCIMEMPALLKAEEKMSGKPVQFVTISIDKDKDTGKWIAAAKQHRLFDQPSQYRLANAEKSPLTTLIHLRSIPRYLLIDQRGNIIDDDFYRPSDDRFQVELNKHLH